jgi:hypothetical protein
VPGAVADTSPLRAEAEEFVPQAADMRDGGGDGSWDALSAGEAVRAFYHATNHPLGYRYVRQLDPFAADQPPPQLAPNSGGGSVAEQPQPGSPKIDEEDEMVVGLSTGWIPATVVEDYNAPADTNAEPEGDPGVLVQLHGRFADPYRQDPEPVVNMYWRLPRAWVRPATVAHPAAALSLLVARWFEYFNRIDHGRTHHILNETLFLDLFEGKGSPHQAFGPTGSYEVYTAFVRNSGDLRTLAALPLVPALRGRRRAGLYFLWPTQRPAVERRDAGQVAEPALRDLMRRMEAAGVRTCWPHPSNLYQDLAGKLWAPRLGGVVDVDAGTGTESARERLGVPPTVTVSQAEWAAGSHAAAEAAIAKLRCLRAGPKGPALSPATYRGVAKLGFSWQGEGVRPFVGVEGLVNALEKLLDGADPSAQCLVQERVEDVRCELRVACFRDLTAGPEAVRKELVRMRLHKPRHHGLDSTFQLTSSSTMTFAEAAEQAFCGDVAALEAAETEAMALAERWLTWFRTEGFGVPHVCRLDFLATLPAAVAGRPCPGSKGSGEGARLLPRVFTVELTECGGASCGVPVVARTTAVLNECLRDTESETWPPGFPQPLPSTRPPVPSTFSSRRVGGNSLRTERRPCHETKVADVKEPVKVQSQPMPVTDVRARVGPLVSAKAARLTVTIASLVLFGIWKRRGPKARWWQSFLLTLSGALVASCACWPRRAMLKDNEGACGAPTTNGPGALASGEARESDMASRGGA